MRNLLFFSCCLNIQATKPPPSCHLVCTIFLVIKQFSSIDFHFISTLLKTQLERGYEWETLAQLNID